MEDEVKRCENEKIELEKDRENKMEEFKLKIKSIEEEKEKLQQNIQMSIQVECLVAY